MSRTPRRHDLHDGKREQEDMLALQQDKHAHLLKPEDFTAERLGRPFQAWAVTLRVFPGQFADQYYTTTYWIRGGRDPSVATAKAFKLFDKWEVEQRRGLPMAPANVSTKAVAEALTDSEYIDAWKEAQHLKRRAPHRVGLYHKSGTDSPTHWEQEKNPMAFVFYPDRGYCIPDAGELPKPLIITL